MPLIWDNNWAVRWCGHTFFQTRRLMHVLHMGHLFHLAHITLIMILTCSKTKKWMEKICTYLPIHKMSTKTFYKRMYLSICFDYVYFSICFYWRVLSQGTNLQVVHVLTHIKFDKLQCIKLNVLLHWARNTKYNLCNLYQLIEISQLSRRILKL